MHVGICVMRDAGKTHVEGDKLSSWKMHVMENIRGGRRE